MSRPFARVVKVGGSLLDDAGLGDRLNEWLARQSPKGGAIVVGGGRLVDEIRRLDQRHRLANREAHWLAIEAMGVTARLVAALVPMARLATSRADIEAIAAGGGWAIVDPAPFLRAEDQGLISPLLPESWDVTSDSIAARVADQLGAGELVLLKSAPPPAGRPIELAELGYVDRHFPIAAARLESIRYETL